MSNDEIKGYLKGFLEDKNSLSKEDIEKVLKLIEQISSNQYIGPYSYTNPNVPYKRTPYDVWYDNNVYNPVQKRVLQLLDEELKFN